jgi:hypothetical protein
MLLKNSGVSAAAGLKSGQFNRIKNLTKYNFIFLTGSTGWTGYSPTKQKDPVDPVILSKSV